MGKLAQERRRSWKGVFEREKKTLNGDYCLSSVRQHTDAGALLAYIAFRISQEP